MWRPSLSSIPTHPNSCGHIRGSGFGNKYTEKEECPPPLCSCISIPNVRDSMSHSSQKTEPTECPSYEERINKINKQMSRLWNSTQPRRGKEQEDTEESDVKGHRMPDSVYMKESSGVGEFPGAGGLRDHGITAESVGTRKMRQR